MADIIKNQIINDQTPAPCNERVTACASDGKVIEGIISSSAESDCREIARMTRLQLRCRIMKVTLQ